MECIPGQSDSEALPIVTPRPTLHVEVCLNLQSTAKKSVIKEHVLGFLSRERFVCGDTCFQVFDDEFLTSNLRDISIPDTDNIVDLAANENIDLNECELHLHIFPLTPDGPEREMVEDENIAAANHWILPSEDFHGMWDSLVFDSDVKLQLLNYMYTTLLFSDRGVDDNVISWNRVILLHGPPGTGKTSLCKALAQKLTIRLSDRFRYGQFIEINSHSLFSKWFSESGKLVLKMFQMIHEIIDDKDALVCVLIDEVESLTAARASAMKGSEPSDAIRVVNALLSQLDQIKKCPNVIILTTSNITGAIDLAFVDRADIKQYIGPPSVNAIYKIFRSCLKELSEKGIVHSKEQTLPMRSLQIMRFVDNEVTRPSLRLREIARKSHGLSGRTLRKLPFLAFACYIQQQSSTLSQFLDALSGAVDKQLYERKMLNEDPTSTSKSELKPIPNNAQFSNKYKNEEAMNFELDGNVCNGAGNVYNGQV